MIFWDFEGQSLIESGQAAFLVVIRRMICYNKNAASNGGKVLSAIQVVSFLFPAQTSL